MPRARDLTAGILDKAGPRPITPAGAHYVMTDSTALGLGDGTTAATALVCRARVAAVPGSSFYSWPELGRGTLPFSFSKKLETLDEAGRRMSRLHTPRYPLSVPSRS